MATVLLVEDHPMNRKLFRDILGFEFEQVIEAETAAAAREILLQTRPDLILMDIQLPDLDGISFVREIKAQPMLASIPIIAVSAHAMKQDIDQARAAGCCDYVTKPITDDPFVLLERLKRSMISARPSS